MTKLCYDLVYFAILCLSTLMFILVVLASGGFRGGDGGDASPPTSLKLTILAEKSASISNNSAPFRDASPPTSRNPRIPVKTFFFFFFFFFFLETTWFWAKKKVWISDFGRKITLKFGEDLFFFFGDHLILGEKKRLNFRFRPKNHSQFRSQKSLSMKTSEFSRICA